MCLLKKIALFMNKDAFLISEKRPIVEERVFAFMTVCLDILTPLNHRIIIGYNLIY